MNQERNRTAGKTLLMRIASNLYIKIAGHRGKSHLGRANQPGACDQALTVSCIVTQFARESFGIYRDVILNRSFALAHTTKGKFCERLVKLLKTPLKNDVD